MNAYSKRIGWLRRTALFCLIPFAGFCLAVPCQAVAAETDKDEAAAACAALGHGFNLGNMLEAPQEGEWGQTFKDHYAAVIRDAGFQHVRLPLKWSAHADSTAPYKLKPAFVTRVRHILKVCLDAKLRVVLNMHHYDEIYQEPDQHADRFVGMWQQIAETFRDLPPEVYFEPLNEPNSKLTDEKWNSLFERTLGVIRPLHPDRMVIVGPGNWNNHQQIPQLKLPENDRRLIVTFHYYLPFQFTHQQAPWLGKNAPKSGRPFPAQEHEPETIVEHFNDVIAWSKANRRPIYLGEFGAFNTADMDSRARWTKHVRETAEKAGFSWAYWEFCSGFGAYDPNTERWIPPLLEALQGK